MSKPISPDQVSEGREKYIPADVFEVFNEEITKNYTGGMSIVYQENILDILSSEPYNLNEKEIHANRWLDVEEAYRQSGWIVRYDKPCAGEEPFKPYFQFIKGK